MSSSSIEPSIMADPADFSKSSLDTEHNISVEGGPATALQRLIAQATAKYAMKEYNAAAELYAYATELQADLNGEMSSANANLLYAYGRCLYHVAVKKSDVLGLSKVNGGDSKATNGSRKSSEQRREQSQEADDSVKKLAGNTVKTIKEEQITRASPQKVTDGSNMPLFQFTGDENFEDSGDEDSGDSAEDGGEDVDDEDDFSIAYEVLDMARVLLEKRKDEVDETCKGKGKEVSEGRETRQTMELLADTYDLQAEISLEGEKFPTAVTDLKSALNLKNAIFPYESSVVAEAHYKLSLALEFSSVTQQRDENGEDNSHTQVDEGMREEAAHELERAIGSCRLRIQKEEASLQQESSIDGSELQIKRAQIDDVKDMVKELSERLVELRQHPVSINDSQGVNTTDSTNPIAGMLGSMLGQSFETQKAKLEEASKHAQDLTDLVRKKRSIPAGVPEASQREAIEKKENTKRKLDITEVSGDEMDKRPRIEKAKEG